MAAVKIAHSFWDRSCVSGFDDASTPVTGHIRLPGTLLCIHAYTGVRVCAICASEFADVHGGHRTKQKPATKHTKKGREDKIKTGEVVGWSICNEK